MPPTVSALVDTSVWRLAEFARPVKVHQKMAILGREQTLTILAMRRVGPYDAWKERQIESLPTIARPACEGAIRLFDSGELELETLKGTIFGGVVTHLLEKVPTFRATSPIERSRFQQMGIEQYADKSTFVRFCRWLLSLDTVQVEKNPDVRPRFPDSASIERFKEICSDLPEKHFPDAFHLWTAEINGLDYFLSADKKFAKVMTLTKRMRLNSKPLAPRDLLESLGITELDPLPIANWTIRSLV
jgi:hypothetical protein